MASLHRAAVPGFEPGMADSKSAALPLGDTAIERAKWYHTEPILARGFFVICHLSFVTYYSS